MPVWSKRLAALWARHQLDISWQDRSLQRSRWLVCRPDRLQETQRISLKMSRPSTLIWPHLSMERVPVARHDRVWSKACLNTTAAYFKWTKIVFADVTNTSKPIWHRNFNQMIAGPTRLGLLKHTHAKMSDHNMILIARKTYKEMPSWVF